MELILTILGFVVGLAALAWAARHQSESFFESRKRKQLEAEIRAIADDLTTNQEGLCLSELVELLELEMLQEIVVELRKMPSGSRRLQKAVEITGDESYGSAG